MITILPDFREEGWHSMDLCAEMLVKHAPSDLEIVECIPRYQKLLGFLPSKKTINFDRWFNRWNVYPRYVKKLASNDGFFHIVDHSYAHLANFLPQEKVGIYCHDLDAFKCLLTPEQEQRPIWFMKMMTRVFEGFKKARVVFCNTKATQKSILDLGIWKSNEVIHAPLGVAEEFSTSGRKETGHYILHVGSCIPRKRIDVLLRAFSQICKKTNQLKLIQAGGNFSHEQKQQIKELNLEGRIEQRKELSREDLARLYRGAKCLVLTSDSEGFGLPVIEGLSCGARVVATDIPAIREVGGCEVDLFPVGNSDVCAEKVLEIFKRPIKHTSSGLEKYSWRNHARVIFEIYKSMEK